MYMCTCQQCVNVKVMCSPIQVKDVSKVNATHTDSVSVLKNMKEMCSLVQSSEVLVVVPDEHTEHGHLAEDWYLRLQRIDKFDFSKPEWTSNIAETGLDHRRCHS